LDKKITTLHEDPFLRLLSFGTQLIVREKNEPCMTINIKNEQLFAHKVRKTSVYRSILDIGLLGDI
jgi:hypothetical protein